MTTQDASNDTSFAGSKSPVPLYHRLYVILRDKLTSGVYNAGDLLPPEMDLVKAYGVSRVTAKRALDELAAEGLVERSRGRGTVATGKTFGMIGGTPLEAGVETLLSNLETIGANTDVRVIDFRYARAPTQIASALCIPADQEVQKAVRLRIHDDRPLALSTSYIIPEIADTISRDDFEKKSLIQMLSESGVDIELVEQSISATLADDTASSHLAIPSGSPLIKIRRTFFTKGRKPIDHVEILYPAERFEYRITLK